MSDITCGLPDLRCPGCGGPTCGFGPEEICAGLRCLACGWGMVTTNGDHPYFQMARDETPYDVWVEWAGHDRLRVIALVGNALCTGAKATRELIDRNEPIARGVDALEVQHLYSKMRAIGLDIRVNPRFPWRFGLTT